MKPSSQLLTLGLIFLVVAACSDMTPPEPQLEPGGTERSGGTKSSHAGSGGKKSTGGGSGGTTGGAARPTATTGGRSNTSSASSGAGGVRASDGGASSDAGSSGSAGANSGSAGVPAGGGEGSTVGGNGAGGAPNEPLRTTPPFFSEYIEGTGSNKALELAIAEPGRLDGCVIRVYANGALTASRSITLTGILTPELPLVICSPQLAAVSGVVCDYSESLPFNGNDAVLLWCDAEVVDSIGQLGADPGEAGWGGGALRTQDRTLRRACAVTIGDREPSDSFDPAADGWLAAPADAFDGLGTLCEPTWDDGAGGVGGSGGGAGAGGR